MKPKWQIWNELAAYASKFAPQFQPTRPYKTEYGLVTPIDKHKGVIIDGKVTEIHNTDHWKLIQDLITQRDQLLSALNEIGQNKLRQGDAIWMRDTAQAAIKTASDASNLSQSDSTTAPH